jgi:hypothetical protein
LLHGVVVWAEAKDTHNCDKQPVAGCAYLLLGRHLTQPDSR